MRIGGIAGLLAREFEASPAGAPVQPNQAAENVAPQLFLSTSVGEAGFEPATSSSQSSRTTRLCYSPEGRGAVGARARAGVSASEGQLSTARSSDVNAP